MSDDDLFGSGLFIGLLVGALTVLILGVIIEWNTIRINQETADEICGNFTGIYGTTAEADDGKLVCNVPTFDHSTNILIRGKDE